MFPVFSCKQPEACAAVSVYIERITQRSSANFDVWGNRLLISRPLAPCLRNSNGDCMRWPIGRPLEPTTRSPLIGRSVVPGQRRLRIESIDVARGAVHEQEDGVLRFRREVWGLGGKRADVRSARVAREQINERQSCESLAYLPQELAA